ncbi:hypothetical protein SUDANB121_04814 [Nocardiopsis dassonvillei]|uniref:hypothetical protein n=1 Tax=Nocardiopsis dassonvillei TaxID=2014 RepID=UPI003F57A0BE
MIQDDILDTVSALEPAALRERADELSRLHRDRVLERARAAGGRRAFLRAAADRRWRLPVTAGALATAGAVAAALFVYSPGQVVVPGEGGAADVQNNDVRAPAYADAQELFAAAAEAAAAEEEPTGSIWYLRTRNQRPAGPFPWGEGGYTVHQAYTNESWTELGGGFRSLNNLNLDVENVFPSEEDRRAWEEAGSPELEHTTPRSTAYRGETVGPFGVGSSALLDLPGDAEGLEDLLREAWREEVERTAQERAALGETGGNSEEDFDAYVRELFSGAVTGPLRGDTRGAFFTLASQIEGIRLIGPDKDPIGRAGYKVAVPYPLFPEDEGLVSYWVVDPGTGTLLSEQGAEDIWVAYEEAGFVEEIGEPAVPVDYEDLYGN